MEKIELTNKEKVEKSLNDNYKENLQRFNIHSDYMLILSGDCLILFDVKETGTGVIVFWSSLFAITDLQLNKVQKVVSINFYDDEGINYILRIILFFYYIKLNKFTFYLEFQIFWFFPYFFKYNFNQYSRYKVKYNFYKRCAGFMP